MNEEKYCKCNCGRPVKSGKRFVKGHNLRKFNKKTNEKAINPLVRILEA